MSSTILDDQEELNQVTIEVLELLNNLKKKTKESMVSGETSIIKGITLFEEVIRELNPNKIDDNVISIVISYASIILFKQEEKKQHVDVKMRYGINQCYMLIDVYNKSKKRELVRAN